MLEAPLAGSGFTPRLAVGIADFPAAAQQARHLPERAEQALASALAEEKKSVVWTVKLPPPPPSLFSPLLTGQSYRDYRNVSAVLGTLERLHGSGNLAEALEEFLGATLEISGAEEAYLILLGGEEPTLKVHRLAGTLTPAELKERAEELTRRAAERDEAREPAFDREPLAGSLTLFWVPLRLQDQAVGCLALAGHPDRIGVESVDQPFFEALARQVSFSLYWILREEEEREKLRQENEALRSQIQDGGGAFIGDSLQVLEVLKQVAKVADADITVLITGESGTGKERIARQLHQGSCRRSKPFVVVDCTSLPAGLFESEIFGHEAGAFTGATSRKIGLLESAAGGTVFFDEVGDLPLEAQAKILRFLQERQFHRVGGTESISVPLRVVAATNRELPEEIRAGRFREDLWFRLQGCLIPLPALRVRKRDLLPLARHFLERAALKHQRTRVELAPEAEEALVAYAWPGNIRELENKMEWLALMAQGAVAGAAELQLPGPGPGTADGKGKNLPAATGHPGLYGDAQEAWKREYIRRVLAITRGNVSQSAREAGLSRTAFQLLMRRTGAHREEFVE